MTAKEDVLNNFDFEKVSRVMKFVDWKYWDTVGESVTISELKRMASSCVDSLLSHPKSISYGTGGFVAKWEYDGEEDDEHKMLKLEFVLTTAYEYA